jgi:RNA polymerase sigma-70 factor (ECF subfamily)
MMQNLNDEQLFALLKKSNLEALRTIYDRYYDQLYIFASLQNKDPEEAKDVVQDVFYQLWNKRKFIFIKKSLKAYLYRMTYNGVINKRTKNRRIKPLQQEDDYIANSIDTCERLDQKIDLEMAINKLPEKIRPVYILKAMNDLSNKEIASTLSISIKTVEAHITEAYKILRNLFFA